MQKTSDKKILLVLKFHNTTKNIILILLFAISQNLTASDKVSTLERRADSIMRIMVSEYHKQYKKPFETTNLTDSTIWNTRLYKFCQQLPKGGELHVHSTALLAFDDYCSFLESQPNIYIQIEGDNIGHTLYQTDPYDVPAGYLPARTCLSGNYLTRDRCLKLYTFNGGSQPNPWKDFQPIFRRIFNGAFGSPENFEKYMENAFNIYVENNIQFAEIRIGSTMDRDIFLSMAEMIMKACNNVRKKADFHVSIIGTGNKGYSLEEVQKRIDNVAYVQQHIKDTLMGKCNVVTGFDLVSNEDCNNGFEYYYDVLKKCEHEHPDLKLYLHAGETKNTKNDNIMWAIKLGAKRIGHAFNMYFFPDLYNEIRQNDICIETCPLSSVKLGYCSDMKSHPSIEYIHSGLPAAICSDDPTIFEHTALTDDFFAVIAEWNLSLSEVKQLCMNSITYSSLSKKAKKRIMKDWKKRWTNFIQDIAMQK